MPSLVLEIRGVEDWIRDELEARAARRGQSLTAYLRDLLEREAATPEPSGVFPRVDARSESSDVSSVSIIRADRDGR